MKKILVLGVGNPIRGDDGVGIEIARKLRADLAQVRDAVEVMESQRAGADLLGIMSGYSKVIIVDAIRTQGGIPGKIYRLNVEDFKKGKVPYSLHQVGLFAIIDMTKALEMDIPKEIAVIAVERESGDNFEQGLSVQVSASVDKVIDMIKQEVGIANNAVLH